MSELSLLTKGALLALLACVVYKTLLYPIFISPLARIPAANPLATFTGAWIWWKRFRECDSLAVHKAHLAYGDFVRLSPSEISVNCVEGGVKEIYKFDKHLWYGVFENYGSVLEIMSQLFSIPTMFGSLRKSQHAPTRRQVSKIYTRDEVLNRPLFDQVCEEVVYNRWIPLLEKSASKAEPIDVYELDLAITFDLAAAYIYGLPNVTNFVLDVAERRHWQENYKVLKNYMFYSQEMHATTNYWLPSWGINPFPRKLDTAVDNIEAKGWELAQRVESREQEGIAGDDEGILYHQLRNTVKDGSPDSEFERKKRASEMIDHCFAGHGTASIVLTYMYHHLSIYPHYQKLLQNELSGLGKGRPTQKEVDQLPLLEAIILETLRLYPSPPASQPRITPDGGCTLGPYAGIPGGVRVSAQAYSLHRNEAVYPDPERWWPERWLPFCGERAAQDSASDASKTADDQARLAEMQRWYLGFGQGTRACPGKDYGMLGIKAVMAATYSQFSSTLAVEDDMRQMDGNSEGQPAGQRCLIAFTRRV